MNIIFVIKNLLKKKMTRERINFIIFKIVITDLQDSWFTRGNEEKINSEKNKFIKSIETNDIKGTCQILEAQINKFNQSATYLFQKVISQFSQ